MPIAQRTPYNRHAFHSTQQPQQPQQTTPATPLPTVLPPFPYVNPTVNYTLTKTVTPSSSSSSSSTTTEWRFKKPAAVNRSPALNLKTVAEEVKQYLLGDLRGVRAKNELYKHMQEKFSHVSAHLVRAKVFDVLRVMEGIGALEMFPEVVKWRQTVAPGVIDPNWEWEMQFEESTKQTTPPTSKPPSPKRPSSPKQTNYPQVGVKRVRFDDTTKEEFMDLLWDIPKEGEIDTWSTLFMDDFNF